jgi:hypothetical protein|eukprot:COSAG02_NODE_1990_length_10170_cov_4.723645_4_plen_99_part_00
MEKFFQITFELLDERMQYRELGRSGGDNDWETKFAKDTYVVCRLALTASHHSTGTRANRANANEMCGPSAGVSLGLKVEDSRNWERQNPKTGSGPPRW